MEGNSFGLAGLCYGNARICGAVATKRFVKALFGIEMAKQGLAVQGHGYDEQSMGKARTRRAEALHSRD